MAIKLGVVFVWASDPLTHNTFGVTTLHKESADKCIWVQMKKRLGYTKNSFTEDGILFDKTLLYLFFALESTKVRKAFKIPRRDHS